MTATNSSTCLSRDREAHFKNQRLLISKDTQVHEGKPEGLPKNAKSTPKYSKIALGPGFGEAFLQGCSCWSQLCFTTIKRLL